MNDIKTGFRLFIALTVLTGIIYPLLVTAAAQGAMNDKANGSLIVQGGKVVGSHLIGQDFSEPWYFWGRPSATPESPYNAAASSGSNLGPTNPDLLKRIKERVEALRRSDSANKMPVPTDLATASGSGLDPDISIEAAYYQIARIAKARNATQADVKRLVDRFTIGRQLGFLGEPRVRVLELNSEMDRLLPLKQ